MEKWWLSYLINSPSASMRRHSARHHICIFPTLLNMNVARQGERAWYLISYSEQESRVAVLSF